MDSYNHIFELTGHTDEVLDVTFDYTGGFLATASSDCTARVWSVLGDLNLICTMDGHIDEVSKVSSEDHGHHCSLHLWNEDVQLNYVYVP